MDLRDCLFDLATVASCVGDLSVLRFKSPDSRRFLRCTEEDGGLNIVEGEVIVDLRDYLVDLATKASCIGDLSALRFKSPDSRRFVR